MPPHDTKESFEQMLTLYGRHPVLEALDSPEVTVRRVHLAREYKASSGVKRIIEMARDRDLDIRYHSKLELSRISGNARQDQGVAVDLIAPRYHHLNELPVQQGDMELLVLDGITNPQNLGMIIRTVAGSPLAGLVLPRQGCAPLNGLTIKASAGNLFRCRIWHCEALDGALDQLQDAGFELVGLAAKGEATLGDVSTAGRRAWILGGESQGLSEHVLGLCHRRARIPLANDVESLNVGTAAAIVAFRSLFTSQ